MKSLVLALPLVLFACSSPEATEAASEPTAGAESAEGTGEEEMVPLLSPEAQESVAEALQADTPEEQAELDRLFQEAAEQQSEEGAAP